MVTEYICWESSQGFRQEDLERAAAILREGGLVAFPTETVYGLGANGLDPEAVKKIYEAKGRPSDNPLILHISKRDELEKIVSDVSDNAESLMEAFWPGPMTLIFHKKDSVPYETTGGLDTVAVRMPDHEGACALIAATGLPIAAPSANTSGRPSPTTAEHVREDLDGRVDMIIDGGPGEIGVESTIVDLTGKTPVILRPGHITKKMIEAVVGEVHMDPGLMDETEKPKAPGMKYRHYAPKAEMTVFEGEPEAVIEKISECAVQYESERVGILATDESLQRYEHGQVLSVGSRKAHTIEQGLYKALRTFDHMGVDVILSESFSREDKGEAIMNRLLKAAGHHVVSLSEEQGGRDMVADYNKIIFVCKENVTLSPMAEWIMKSILMDKSKEICSRGLVVLFSEPRNQKVTDLLNNHSVPCEEQVSEELVADEVSDQTLVLTMNFTEKVKLIEDWGLTEHVYTLKEFAEQEEEGESLEPDVLDPYSGDGDVYEESYVELKDLLYKVKKKLRWN